MIPCSTKIASKKDFRDRGFDTLPGKKFEKDDSLEKLEKLKLELEELQEQLYAAGSHAVLVVLQGMDTSGKDGAVRKVFASLNPQGCRVESFKAPTSEELAHDFLWRVHRVVPKRGMISVFNRSHYEDVLITRVHNLVSEEECKQRYLHINAFEQLLVDSNVIVIKFFLNISKDEQKSRLEAREKDPQKGWKLNADDWEERKKWPAYEKAYRDVFAECSSESCPWYIVPADKKWFRDVTIAETLVATLRPYAKEWQRIIETDAKKKLQELQKYRKTSKSSSERQLDSKNPIK